MHDSLAIFSSAISGQKLDLGPWDNHQIKSTEKSTKEVLQAHLNYGKMSHVLNERGLDDKVYTSLF